MPIVSSGYIVGHAQADGRRYITEVHIDHLDATHVREYLATPGTDYDVVLTARAAQLEIDFAEAEADALLK